MSAAVYLIHCLRPLHLGAGSGLGAIDRPIAREVHSGFPYVQSSSIKGTARAMAAGRGWSPKDVEVCFGPEKTGERSEPEKAPGPTEPERARKRDEGRQGALVVTDALLLLFPVRSDAATWVWATCPLALARFVRWCELAGEAMLRQYAEGLLAQAAMLTSEQQALAGTADDVLRLSSAGPYAFADDTFVPVEDAAARGATDGFGNALAERLFPRSVPPRRAGETVRTAGHHAYWREFLARRLVVVQNQRLSDLVERFTVVEPGIAINDDTGTTTDGSLRYTEFLPEESVLFSYVTAEPSLSGHKRPDDWVAAFTTLIGASWQIGADETKGKGIVRAIPVAEEIRVGA